MMLVEMLIRKGLISPNFLKVSAPTGTAAFQIGGGEILFIFLSKDMENNTCTWPFV